MKVSPERLMAYIDRQLPPAEMREIDRLLALDPALRAALDPYTLTRDILPELHDHVLTAPIPQRLLDTVSKFGSRKPPPLKATSTPSLLDILRGWFAPADGWGLGMAAASLFAVLAAGGIGFTLGQSSGGDVEHADATSSPVLAANYALAEALERAPSVSDPSAPAAAIQPVATFLDKDRRPCREYRLADAAGRAGGIACRTEEGRWQVVLHTPLEPRATPAAESYQSASGPGEATIDATVEALKSGDVLGSETESALMSAGWNSR